MSDISTEAIRQLRDEAGSVGDTAQVEICDRALAGDAWAIGECARVIAVAVSWSLTGDSAAALGMDV